MTTDVDSGRMERLTTYRGLEVYTARSPHTGEWLVGAARSGDCVAMAPAVRLPSTVPGRREWLAAVSRKRVNIVEFVEAVTGTLEAS